MSSLNSFSNLFPDQIHYHSLELNEKFSTYEMSPGQRINSFQVKPVSQWHPKVK